MATFTLPTNLLSTYDVGFFGSNVAASGIIHHEDLTDVLTIIDSVQTPFFSGAPKIRAKDVVHSWPIDRLATPVTASSPDGVDFNSGTAPILPTRLINGTHIFRKDVVVSDRERDANPAGIRDMYEHQVMKRFKEVARDFEYTTFRISSTASATGLESSAASGGPIMGGFQAFFTSGLTTAGSAGPFSTAKMMSLAMTMFNNGAEPDSVWLSPPLKLDFFNAVGASAIVLRNVAAADNAVNANIDIFESPFGQRFAVIVDRFIPMQSAAGGTSSSYAYYLGDRSLAKVAFFRPPQHKQLGKTGDNTKGIVLMEATLEVTHVSAWGAVTAVTSIAGDAFVTS